MKKIFLAVAAMAMLATACTKDDAVSGGGESLVSFTIDSPELQTRYGEGETVDNLEWAFYDENGDRLEALCGSTKALNEVFEGSYKLTVSLVDGRQYTALFWASKDGAPYSVNWDSKTMTIDTDALKANQEAYDAFYKYTAIDQSKKVHKIELTRPFAQINIATKDYNKAVNAGVTVVKTEVTVNAYTTLKFDAASVRESVADQETLVYTMSAKAEGTALNDDECNMLAMNYVLVGDRELVNVTMKAEEADGTFVTREYTTVPVQRNYRTYIVGNLLTTSNDFNIETKPGFDGEEVSVVWDGTSTTKPAYDDATKTYTVKTGAELAWLANLVNGTLPSTMRSTEYADAESLQGVTIELNDNIDLGGNQWTPIGNNTNKFQGTFDGKGFTVGNLVVTGNNSYVGLFGFTTNGEIKNLVVENAKVSGRLGVGVVAGSPYTSKFTNITVKGHVEVNGMAYVGGVGGRNAYANWTNITVNVDETSYVKANSVENGTAYRTYVGGVIGFMGEGGHTVKNVKSNIDVEGSTIDAGGVVGIAHYGNNFENIDCSGNVEITGAEDEVDAEEIGGIAGVWMDHTEGNVTFTNCKFTGTLTTNVAGVDLSDNTITGKAYNENGKGMLIIDGKTPSQARLEAAIAQGGEVELTEDVTLTTALNIDNDVTIDLNGYDLDIAVAYDDNNAYASSAIVNNGTLTLTGNGKIKAINNYTVRNYGTMTIDGVTIENGIMNFNDLTVEDGNISNSRTGKHAIYGNNAKLTINGGTFYNGNPGNAAIFAYAGEVEINGGEFSIADGTSTLGWTSCLLDAQGNAKFTINGGVINGEIRDYNKNTTVYGGVFTHASVKNFVAEGYKAMEKGGKWHVVPTDVDAIITVTPANIGTMTFDADNAIYKFEGAFTNATFKAEANKAQTFDGSAATFNGPIKFTAARIAGNQIEVTTAKSGNYTLKGFATQNSICVGSWAVEALNIEDCEAYMVYLNISNSNVKLSNNTIVRPATADDAYSRYDGGIQKDIIQVYAENYNLQLVGNTIKDEKGVGNNIEVYGEHGWQSNATWTNSIAATGNIFGNVNNDMPLVKIYNDVTFAPVAWPADYEITDAAVALAKQLKEENTLSGGSCVVDVLCRRESGPDANIKLYGTADDNQWL